MKVNILIETYLKLLNNLIRSASNMIHSTYSSPYFLIKLMGRLIDGFKFDGSTYSIKYGIKEECCEWSSSIGRGNSNYTVRSRPIIVGEWFSMVTTSERFSFNWTWTNLAHSRKMKRMEEREELVTLKSW